MTQQRLDLQQNLKHEEHDSNIAIKKDDIPTDNLHESDIRTGNPDYQGQVSSYYVTMEASSHQQDLYNFLHPLSNDDVDTEWKDISFERQTHLIIQAHTIDESIDLTDLQFALSLLRQESWMFRMAFFRNDMIVDADVKLVFDSYPNKVFEDEVSEYCEINQSDKVRLFVKGEQSNYDSLAKIVYVEDISDMDATIFIRSFIESRESVNLHRFFLLRSKISLARTNTKKQRLIIVASSAVADELTCSLLGEMLIKRLKNTKNSLEGRIRPFYKELQVNPFFKSISRVKRQKDRHPTLCKDAATCYREQFLEFSSNGHDHIDKSEIKVQISNLENDLSIMKPKLQILQQRKTELEQSVINEIDKRKQIEAIELKSGKGEAPVVFIDAVTGECVEVESRIAEELMISTVGKAESETFSRDFLRKHHIEEDTIEQIVRFGMTFQKFVQLSPRDLENVPQKERNTVLALVEYICGKLKDHSLDHAKYKLNLERSIQKQQRDLLLLTDSLKSLQNEHDRTDDSILKLKTLLDPPLTKQAIPIAHLPFKSCLEIDESEKKNKTIDIENMGEMFSFYAVTFPSNMSEIIKSFTENWLLNSMTSSLSELNSSTDTSLRDFKDDNGERDYRVEANRKKFSTTSPSLLACLAAFCTLIKHIFGEEKFVIGVRLPSLADESEEWSDIDDVKQDEPISVIGPLTCMLPFKVDLSQQGYTFGELFGDIRSRLHELMQYASIVSSLSWRKEIAAEYLSTINAEYSNLKKVNLTLPIQLLYLNQRAIKRFASNGIQVAAGLFAKASLDWSVDLEEPYDLRLIVLEDSNGEISGGFQYRHNVLDEEKVRKWSERFLNILSNIEHGGSKSKLSHLIGRFYQNVWSSVGSNIDLASGSADLLN